MFDTTVFNLATGEYGPIYTLEPRDAVIAAHAQVDQRNFATWEYEALYGAMVVEGEHTVRCGDFSAMKEAHALA